MHPWQVRPSSSGRKVEDRRDRDQDVPAVSRTPTAWRSTSSSRAPTRSRTVVYKLLGPHGIPIEGEWYTGTFRDAVFGASRTAHEGRIRHEIGQRHRQGEPESRSTITKLPLKFAGVENQYFAIARSSPMPQPSRRRRIAGTARRSRCCSHKDEKASRNPTSASRSRRSRSRSGPNCPLTHTYRVFAGPKTAEALKPYRREELALYRKTSWHPVGAPDLPST